MEGIINPLVVNEPLWCGACGHAWLDYDLGLEREGSQVRRSCPVCGSTEVRASSR